MLAAFMAGRCNYFYYGTEFGGGFITGPLVKMNSIGGLLFLLAPATSFWRKRTSATITFIAVLMSLPLYAYLICPRLFRIFTPQYYASSAYSLFYWRKWPTVGIFAILAAACLSYRNISESKTANTKILLAFIGLACLLCPQLIAQELHNTPSLLARIDVPGLDDGRKAIDGQTIQKIDTPQGEIGIRREQGSQMVYFKNKILLKNDSTIFLGAYAIRRGEKPSLFLIESNCAAKACDEPDIYLVDLGNGAPYISPALSLAHDSRSIFLSEIDGDTYKI